MSEVLMPQMMAQTSNKLIMSSQTSQTKISKENTNLQNTNHQNYICNSNNNNSTNSGNVSTNTVSTNTTPIDGNRRHQYSYSSSDSTIINSEPESPTQLLDFDDFTSTSSIMEFLRQEQRCVGGGDSAMSNGHDSEVDAESIFQEVSRLADNSDTRSVDELLREAELLLQHQHFMGNIRQPEKKMVTTKTMTKTTFCQLPPSIKMNSKYTKSIENVPPRNSMVKLINGYVPATTPLDECSPPLMTPETPTVTYSLSDGVGSGNTFNNFVNNIPTESVISEESTPGDFPDDNTVTITTHSSNDTTGKDITTKQIDGDDTDDGTDTIEEITEAMETIELIVHDDDADDDDDDDGSTHHNDADGHHGDDGDDRKEPKDQFVAMPRPPSLNASHENLAGNNIDSLNLTNSTFSSISSIISTRTIMGQQPQHGHGTLYEFALGGRRPSCEISHNSQQQLTAQQSQQKQTVSSPNLLASPVQQRLASNANSTTTSSVERCNSGSYLGRRSSMTTPDSGVSSSQTYLIGTSSAATLSQRSSSPNVKSIGIGTTARSFCDKSVNSSPVHVVSTLTSPINETATTPQLASSSSNHSMVSISREHALKNEIEQLQERLKDTEERLESFRIQHDTVSQLHRKLRESNTQLQDESEMLKLDVQHLNECANVLRTELQAARNDRDEALELQKVLQNELEETRAEKKKALEMKEKDVRTIQDLQRQCREMERILMRKHPDSVSALIVASKNSGMSSNDQENHNSRKLLEQRIAQLEADAKEQDFKAQQILANVQARFNSVQAKYETHIADLETQVLSLQEINTKLNEKIESQVRTLDYFVSKKAEKFYNNCTQTEEPYMPVMPVTPVAVTPKARKICRKTISTQTATSCTRESSTNTIGSAVQQHSASSSTSSTANSTPNNSRPNSKQSGIRKPLATTMGNHLSSAIASKLPISQSDSTISLSAAQAALNAKEDAHLLATIRGMRVDLAIKNKAMQRLTRELDECKRTIKKIQREKDAFKYDKHHSTAASASSSSSRLNMDHMPATTESQALKEAQNKYKLLEADYKSLHDKRLQDLKTLQTAHERELATCHETVRLLQQRLNERDEQFAMQKRRKVPVDYYALKAKVSSLERRHTEREERLHMLVEALSKGRLNGALDDLLTDNNNQ